MVAGSAIAALVLLQVSGGLWQTHVREEEVNKHSEDVVPKSLSLSSRFAALEAMKLTIALAILLVYRRRRKSEQEWKREHRRNETEELPLNETNGSGDGLGNLHDLHESLADGFSSARGNFRGYSLQLGSGVSYAALTTISFLLATKSYFTLSIYESDIIDPLHVYLSASIVPLLSAAILFILFKQLISPRQWIGIVLQICGIYSAQALQLASNISWSLLCILIALALFTSFTFVGLEFVYGLHDRKDPHGLNIILFATALFIHLSIVISAKLFYSSYEDVRVSAISSGSFTSLLLRSGIDITSILVIFYHDVITFAVSSLFSVAMLSLYSHLLRGVLTINDISASTVSLLGFLIYLVGRNAVPPSPSTHFEKTPWTKRTSPIFLFIPLFATFAYLGYSTFSFEVRHDMLGTKSASSRAYLDSIFTDLLLLTPPPPSPSGCSREALPSLRYYEGNRTYHEFDDVLLIVFFSHPRYDINMDYYKEVYSEFFPNMVFVGPRNREDLGFNHSYDVLVDSYEADEDLSDWNDYKMAGRMAHHMLYTVLTTPPYSNGCYNGYLWAPFDTLLNVPRLQQFDQNKTWYFSPWAEYVPNIAMNETAQMNASFHAPPARISPDPAKNLTEGFTGWWVDWWWGDPHFGIPVCMPAFQQVALEMRELMSSRYLNDTTRFLGGSADTLYIPERLKGDFLHVLGLFLNTSCFLEIAVPTTVHLIIPENDTIQFVDHWWIWDPPFNSSFVRQIWQKGMEVDTFHTFHWGDKGEDGKWRAIPENIEDVRLLLRESAKRQNVSLGQDPITDTNVIRR